jgi:hypothetical protein
MSNGTQIMVQSDAISLTDYKLTVSYTATIQKQKMTVVISLFSRRLLQERLLSTSYLNSQFDFTISTYPPAYYYPEPTVDLFALFSKLIKGLSIATLILALVCYIGKTRTVFYSIEATNLLVILYISQGFGLDQYIDWLGYTITNMKESTLIGGFSLNDC